MSVEVHERGRGLRSPVFWSSEEVAVDLRLDMRRRKEESSDEEDEEKFPRLPILPRWTRLVDSPRNWQLLRRMRNRIGQKRLRRIARLKGTRLPKTMVHSDQLDIEVRRNTQTDRRNSRHSRIYERIMRAIHFDPRIMRLLQKHADLTTLTDATRAEQTDPRKQSKALGIRLNRLLYLRQLRSAPNYESPEELETKINRLISHTDQLLRFLQTASKQENLATISINQLLVRFRATDTTKFFISRHRFYDAMLRFGLRFRSISYARKIGRPVPASALIDFADVLLFFLLLEEESEFVAIDESTICPSNFKRRGWRMKGTDVIVRSAIKYEGVSLLAAVSRNRLEAIQLFLSHPTSEDFIDFVRSLVHKFRTQNRTDRPLVLMLDNASIHRSRRLAAFCRKNGVLLFYNMANFCALNMVEYFWCFAKRPLRTTTDYDE